MFGHSQNYHRRNGSRSLPSRKLLTFLIALSAVAFVNLSAPESAHAWGCRGWAQTIGGNGCNSSITPATYQGPGDVVSGAAAWWSCARAYSSAVTAGTAMCDLVDSLAPTTVICTLQVGSNGFVNLTGTYCTGSVTPAVKCAAATGGVCNVKQAYDQTGNGIHVLQATAANQPTLTFSALNGLPGITSAGGSVLLGSSTSLTATQPWTVSAVAERTGNFTTQSLIIGRTDGATQMSYSSSANTVFVFAGTSLGTAPASDSAFHAMQGSANNSVSSHLYIDGTNFSVSLNNSVGFSGNVSVAAVTGIVMEAGVWGIDFNSSSQNFNMNTNQHGTNGYNF